MPTLHVLIGPSGCGKSSWARSYIQDYPDVVYLNADTMRGVLSGDESDQSVSYEAFCRLEETCAYFAYLGSDIIIDNLNLKASSRKKWLSILDDYTFGRNRKHKYDKVAHVFWTDQETCGRNLATRSLTGGRNIPDDVLGKQFETYNQLIKDGPTALRDTLIQEGFDSVEQ
jgi:predicted kinase